MIYEPILPKRCTKCLLWHPATLEYFAEHKRGKMLLTSRCRPCRAQECKQWREKNAEHFGEYNRHEYVFSAAQMGELAFLFGALDLDAYAGFTALKKYTDGNGYGVLLQSNVAPMSAQACVVVNADAESADSGTFGLKKWINQIYPLVNVTPLLAQLREVAGADWAYQGIPTEADKFPWGLTLTSTTHGATRAAGCMLTSDYPMVLETLIATTGQTTYALTYTPATPTTQYVVAWKTGTLQTVTTSYAVSGKTVTMTTPAYNDTYVFRYEAVDLLSSN